MKNKKAFSTITKDMSLDQLKHLSIRLDEDKFLKEALLMQLTQEPTSKIEVIEKTNEADVLIAKALKMRLASKSVSRIAEKRVLDVQSGSAAINAEGSVTYICSDLEKVKDDLIEGLRAAREHLFRSRALQADKEKFLVIKEGYQVKKEGTLVKEMKDHIRECIKELLKTDIDRIQKFIDTIKTSKNIPSSKIPKEISSMKSDGFSASIGGETIQFKLSNEEVNYIFENHPNVKVSPALKHEITLESQNAGIKKKLEEKGLAFRIEADPFGFNMIFIEEKKLSIIMDGHNDDDERIIKIIESGAENKSTSTSDA